MPYYRFHLFFCTNQRLDGRICCHQGGATALRAYAKERVKTLGLNRTVKVVRINNAGCLGRCHEGPTVVVYPEAIWYRVQTTADVDAILEQHIQQGAPVQHLQI